VGVPELGRVVGQSGQQAVEVLDIDVLPQSARYVTDGGVGRQVMFSAQSLNLFRHHYEILKWSFWLFGFPVCEKVVLSKGGSAPANYRRGYEMSKSGDIAFLRPLIVSNTYSPGWLSANPV
jgi:hypothetical protein